MNLPAEIVNNVPAILEFGRHALTSTLSGQMGNFAWNQIRRGLSRWIPQLHEADPKELAERLSRVETTMIGMIDELSRIKSEQRGSPPSDDEMREPATQDFIADTFAAAMESPNEEKRELLGRLIAQRLYATTESPNELHLRQALDLIRRLNQDHLHLLATIYLVQQTPMPTEKISRRELYRWLDQHMLPLLDRFCPGDPNYEDLAYLQSVGGVTYSEPLEDELLGGLPAHASPIEQHIIKNTQEYLMPTTAVQVGRFYLRADELYKGELDRSTGDRRIALGPYMLTLAGEIIAQLVLRTPEQHVSLGSGDTGPSRSIS